MNLQKINKILQDHEQRICALESTRSHLITSTSSKDKKQKTLREIVKGRNFKNGQEQIAIIVGYYEKIVGTLIHKDNLKTEWINAKMINKYNPNFLKRAKDDLIRIHPEGACDLTQTGEDFFERFIGNKPKKLHEKSKLNI